MLEKFHYTDKEVEAICKSIVVLVDTREQKNDHITDWFDKKKIKWKKKAMSNGDYSFYIPKNEELNIPRDLYFDREIMVERKRNLDELATNFTAHRTRLEEELATFGGKKYLLLENTNYNDIAENNYRSKLAVKSYLSTLHTFNHRYNWEVTFMKDDTYSGMWLYGTFFYYLRNLIR
ncbi:ERCC4-type nuclease [Clostridiales Family XIII bacterium PM5-7]